MKFFFYFLIMVSVLMLVGCQTQENFKPSEMNPEDLPNVRAFQDEFTREFLQSTEETREGYYPFLSGTGKYVMDFPAGGKVDDRMYFVSEDEHEEFPVSIEDDKDFNIHIIYYSKHMTGELEENLSRFKKRLSYEGEFESIEAETQSLYYTNYERNGFRTSAGYVQNTNGPGGIEAVYKIDYRGDKEEICIEEKQLDEERLLGWMMSIQFVNQDEE